MAYQAGEYSTREADRIAFLSKREDGEATIGRIFKTYLKSIEDVNNHAAQRNARGAFVDSLLEMASFLQHKSFVLVREDASERGVDIPDVADSTLKNVFAHIESLRVHPNDRRPKRTLIGSSATDKTLIDEATALLLDHDIEVFVR